MLKLHRLYSEPELFEPIDFLDGINLIFGETDETSEKTNGVGKSLSIEFINYCLLKKFSDCRVSKIPSEAFPHNALICLDFSIHGNVITSKRSIENHNSPILIINKKLTHFFNIEDATKQLTHLLFGSALNEESPSFREILGLLIRDERSEFKSIVKCFDTSKRIPENYTPHLYLLGINPLLYRESKTLQKQIDDTRTSRTKIKKDVENLTGKSFKEANSELNELTSQVEKIKDEMDALENAESFKIVKEEIIALEIEIDNQNTKASVLKSELSKIKLFKGDNYIDDLEIANLYGRFKEGLGDMIKREIQEVTAFKKKIDNFQKTLIDSRKESLTKELKEINKDIRALDSRYKNKLTIIDKKGVLKNLKITVSAYQHKLEEQSQLSAFMKKHCEYEQEIKRIKRERENKITILDSLVIDANPIKRSFEESILKIHDYVMGNKTCSFKIEINNKKEIVNYDLRIHDDGSHSNEREKVFFYDIAMLLNSEISKHHPALLIHDNIFDVDQDTLIKSLEYLAENGDILSNKQYILTINSDKLHPNEMKSLKMNTDNYKIASFTKNNRFLKHHYQEL